MAPSQPTLLEEIVGSGLQSDTVRKKVDEALQDASLHAQLSTDIEKVIGRIRDLFDSKEMTLSPEGRDLWEAKMANAEAVAAVLKAARRGNGGRQEKIA